MKMDPLRAMNQPRKGTFLRERLAVTLQYLGNMWPSMRTSSSVWWLPMKTAGRVVPRTLLGSSTSKVTPVVKRMTRPKARAVAHWEMPWWPARVRTMEARTPKRATARRLMYDARTRATKAARGMARDMAYRASVRATYPPRK
jgi:hypothetical protein